MQNKVLGTLLVTLGVTAVSVAQEVRFQVAGPQNGATVRETVKIRIPRPALEGVKYLALGVDGKFRAGVMIPEQGREVKTDLIYTDKVGVMVNLLWNTKAKVRDEETQLVLDGVEDGPHTLELIAYDASNKKIGKQTLTLTVNNRGDLRMPSDGISLAYRFQVGEQSQYRQRTDVEFVNDAKVPTTTVAPRSRSGYASAGRGMGGMQGGRGGMQGGSGGMMGGAGTDDGGSMMGGGGPGMGGRGGMQGGSGSMMGGPGGKMGGPGGMSGSGGMMGSGGMQGGMMGGGMMGGGGGMQMGGGMQGGNPFGDGQPAGPFRLPVQTVKANYTRTTEDRLGPSDYFIRDRVQDGSISSPAGSAKLQDIYDFKSRYRTVSSSGRVLDPGIANGARPGAYVALPMIELGGKRRIGQKWTTRAPILLEWATLDVPTMVPCTNVLEGLEWESGYQCAKIRQTYNAQGNVQIFGGAGKIQNAKIKMDRTIWFSYKAGKIIKTETLTEVEGDAPSDILNAMVPQSGAGGGMMGGGMMGGGMDGEGSMMGGGMQMGGGGMMSGSGGMQMGGKMGGSGMQAGGSSGGFGGMQSGEQLESPKMPAKFRSVTVVELVIPAPALKTALKK